MHAGQSGDSSSSDDDEGEMMDSMVLEVRSLVLLLPLRPKLTL